MLCKILERRQSIEISTTYSMATPYSLLKPQALPINMGAIESMQRIQYRLSRSTRNELLHTFLR